MSTGAYNMTYLELDGEKYCYTVNGNELNYGYNLTIMDCSHIFRESLLKTLDICEKYGAYVNPRNGVLFFKDKERMVSFIYLINKALDNRKDKINLTVLVH